MMDRRQLLDRAARNGDERVLLAHILDKCEQSRNRNIPSATDFLSPAEQRSAQDLLHAAAIHDGCAFCGGFERAERRMLLFLPDWQEEADESEYMTALRCAADVSASGFSRSRGKAPERTSSRRVQLNYRETLTSDAPVAQGDVISARGLGKFEVAEVGGLSKKGRTALLLRRYL